MYANGVKARTRRILSCLLLIVLCGSAFAAELPKVVIVATGGTIAMRNDPKTGSAVPALSGDDLVAAVPGLKGLARVEVVNFSNIASEWMSPEHWRKLSKAVDAVLARPDVAGVVVTHGTDTMEEGAYFLDLTLTSDKPVVFTGAQRDASERDTDGPRNILDAVRVVLCKEAVGKGVTIVLNDYINAAREVRKTHTCNVETFESGVYGFLGYVDADRVTFYRRSLRRQRLPLPASLPRVDLIAMVPGADGGHVRHAVESGAQGIVIEAYGLGNVNEAVYDAVRQAIDKGVPVVITSRVYHGRVRPEYGEKGGGASLKKLGAVFGDDLLPGKARLLLMLALPVTKDPARLQAYFDR